MVYFTLAATFKVLNIHTWLMITLVNITVLATDNCQLNFILFLIMSLFLIFFLF